MKHTGVYIAGKELTLEQLRDYIEDGMAEDDWDDWKLLVEKIGDKLISKAIRDRIEEYIKILEEMENEERE